MKVYQSISEVAAALSKEGISKDRSNQQQGYKFRGIDDCLNALASLLPAHNLVILPEVVERDVVERQTKSGSALFYVTVKVRYTFINTEDGSHHDVVTYGEAMDSADKATNKAMSASYKYAVILAFCIPTEGDNDADATTHDVAARQTEAVARNKAIAKAKLDEIARELSAPVATPSTGAGEGGGQVNPPLQPPPAPLDDLVLAIREAATDQELNKLMIEFVKSGPTLQDKKLIDSEVAQRRKALKA